MPMNKKLILTAWILAAALTTASVTNFTYASDDWIDDDDSSETQDMNDDNEDDDINDDDDDDMNDDKWWKRKEMKKEMKHEKKSAHDDWKEGKWALHDKLFVQLDSSTKDAIEALHKAYAPQFDAIKADTTKSLEEKKVAMDALHTELHAKIKALLPTDLQDDFDAMKAEMKASRDAWVAKKEELKTEWKNKKDEWKAKREERRSNMKGKMRVVFGKLDNVLTKFEGKKTPDQLVTTYTNLITKLDEKIATIDETTELFTFLTSLSEDLSDRVNELKAQ